MKKNFLERAVGLKATNSEYHRIHSNTSFDGYRIHVDNSLPACTCEFCTERVSQVLHQGRMAHKTAFTITTAALVTTCKQALAIGKSDRASDDFIPTLRLSVNGSLKYAASCEGNGTVDGEWTSCSWETTRKTIFPAETVYKTAKTNGITVSRVKVEYSHEGQDLEFGISPKYLLEAIEGMGETVTLKINVRNSPLHSTTRIAAQKCGNWFVVFEIEKGKNGLVRTVGSFPTSDSAAHQAHDIALNMAQG